MEAIRRSARNEKGFTLIEIMIVVLIIGILLAIAVPNFVKARTTSQAKSCVANLKQIDAAKEQYAMDNKLAQGGACAWSNLINTTDATQSYLKTQPSCPAGGTYTVNVIGTDPACSLNASGHVLNP